ncbi:MAG: general secretion pathway protein A, partial [Candidatus Omnitrophota bacterium]
YTVRDRRGAMLLTGLYGCGKTLLSRFFLNVISGPKYEVALINNPRLDSIELLAEIVYQLGEPNVENKTKGQLLRLLNETIYTNLNMGKETIIIIDEAQAIKDLEIFEELRLLLNFQQDNRFLLTLILIGQSELRKKLKQLPQFRQRLMIEYHLNPLSEKDTSLYIEHRLAVSGSTEPIFHRDAKKMIHRFSSGVPRIINGIADMALVEGYIQNKAIVDVELIKKIVNDAQLEAPWAA